MKKVIMVCFLSCAWSLQAKSYLPENEIHNYPEKLSLSDKRRAKKIAYCRQDLRGRHDIVFLNGSSEAKLNEEVLKQIKRRFPKKVDLVKSQENFWPDEYGYNPKTSGRKV